MRSLLATLHAIKPQIVGAYLALAAVILALVSGAVLGSRAFARANMLEVGELHTESRTVDAAGTVSVEAVIVSGFGELNIRGGADQLVELDLVSNVPDMKPVVLYETERTGGTLFISPTAPRRIPDPARIAEYRNEWDVRLNEETEFDLEIVLGTGVGHFDLRGLAIKAVALEVGTGDAVIDLRGDWLNSLTIEIEGGIGKTTLLLPDEVAVRVKPDLMRGDPTVRGLEKSGAHYVNAAFADAEARADGVPGDSSPDHALLDIEADVGPGELTLIVLDEAAVWPEEHDGQETQ